MRKRLIVGLGLGGGAAVLLSGIGLSLCLSGDSQERSANPAPAAEQRPTPQPPPQPMRTSPEKTLNVPEPCSIVHVEQAQALGAHRAPRARVSNGNLGCNYDRGVGFDGFKVFIGTDKTHTMSEYLDSQGASVERVEIAGYPTARKATTTMNCVLVIDISDHGSLIVNTVVGRSKENPTELSEKFATIALENLPNV